MSNPTDTRYMLYNYLDYLWRKRYLIATLVIFMTIAGLLAGITSPKRYEAKISLATFNTAPPSIKELSYLPDIKEQFAGISAYITSGSTLKKVLLKTGIINSNTNEKKIQNLVDELSKDLSVTFVEKNAVEIKLVGGNQKNMLAILKTLSHDFINEFSNPLSSSAKSTAIFLKNQVDLQKSKLNNSIEKLTGFENKNNVYLPKFGTIYTARLGQIINELGDKKAEYKAILAEKNWLANALTNVNPVLGSLEKAIIENDIKLNNMRSIYTDNYPGIRDALQLAESLKTERSRLQNQYPETKDSKIQKLLNTELYSPEKVNNNDKSAALLSTQLKTYQLLEQKLKGLAGQVDDLTAQKKELTYTLKQMDNTEKKLTLLKKAVSENQEVYHDLLKRYDMTSMTMQLNHFQQFSQIKIVSSPQGPLANKGIGLIFYPLIGALGGLVLGFGLAFITEAMSSIVRKKHTIEALSGIPVLSRIEKITVS